jgi:hypothetical protein
MIPRRGGVRPGVSDGRTRRPVPSAARVLVCGGHNFGWNRRPGCPVAGGSTRRTLAPGTRFGRLPGAIRTADYDQAEDVLGPRLQFAHQSDRAMPIRPQRVHASGRAASPRRDKRLRPRCLGERPSRRSRSHLHTKCRCRRVRTGHCAAPRLPADPLHVACGRAGARQRVHSQPTCAATAQVESPRRLTPTRTPSARCQRCRAGDHALGHECFGLFQVRRLQAADHARCVEWSQFPGVVSIDSTRRTSAGTLQAVDLRICGGQGAGPNRRPSASGPCGPVGGEVDARDHGPVGAGSPGVGRLASGLAVWLVSTAAAADKTALADSHTSSTTLHAYRQSLRAMELVRDRSPSADRASRAWRCLGSVPWMLRMRAP